MFNEEQQKAIETIKGQLILVACPGSGKTTTLLGRIHEMIQQGVPAENILMVTFTTAAAGEMKQRFWKKYAEDGMVTFCTIHSFCLATLKKFAHFDAECVLATGDIYEFFFQQLVRHKEIVDKVEYIKALLLDIAVCKNSMCPLAQFEPNCGEKELFDELFKAYENWKDALGKLLVLAGIATVADVVPLIGANRYLVRQSLKLINRGIATSGVLALVRKMRLEKITAEDYGYKIGPVCNASGRLLDDGAMDIFHLLSQELDVFALDYDEQLLKLHALADTVIERNVDRRRITEEALERSDALISQQCLADDAVYIIYDTQVSEGVMGIVAGKLAEKYMRPVIVFAHAQDGEKLKGSGRTYGNIHLKNQVLDPCKEYFFAYGGHAGAAGMTIPEKNLMLFRNKVRKLDIPVLYREKRILYDLEVTKEEIPELYEKMEFFAPFGEGNPEPVFFIRNLELSPVRGKFYEQNGSDGKSIKLFTMPYPSSGYQMAAEYLLMDAPKKIDMTFEVYTIYSHGKEHRRLRMLDFCASKNAETETSFKKELSAMLNFM